MKASKSMARMWRGDFLRSHAITQEEIETVWTAIALHATPGIPQHMDPVVALVTAGVETDVLGIGYAEYSDAEREAVVQAEGQLTIAERTEPQASPRLMRLAKSPSRLPLPLLARSRRRLPYALHAIFSVTRADRCRRRWSKMTAPF
jgi:hypothetical protein